MSKNVELIFHVIGLLKGQNGHTMEMIAHLLIAPLFTIGKIRNMPRCPSIDEWIKEYMYSYICIYICVERRRKGGSLINL